MKSWQPNIYLCLAASLVGIINILVIKPAWAEAKLVNRDKSSQKNLDNFNQQIDSFKLGDRLQKGVKQDKKAPLLKRVWGNREIRQLSDLERPSTSAQMLVQTLTNPPNSEQRSGDQVVPITGVKANATDKGVEVILETSQGTQLQVTNRSAGNSFITDVSGGQLRLPSGSF
ncbi:MAG: AMIN domain-containing protein [Nostoc sp.]